MNSHAKFVGTLVLLGCVGQAPDESQTAPTGGFPEPPIQDSLRVNDQEYPIRLDEEIKLPIRLEEPVVVLTAKPYRTFDYAGVAMPYPRGFTYEVDPEEQLTSWVLSG